MTRGSHMRSATLVALLALTLPTLATARTWHVPGDAPTIQAGIDSAMTGDDVLVAPGVYFEHDILLKAGVWVHSEQGPDQTTIDATGAGVGFTCADLDQAPVVEGFTILNGYAQGGDMDLASGGGVRCVRSQLVIHGCVVTSCTADGLGGGIYASAASTVEIDACMVSGCSASGGGGIAAHNWAIAAITDCEIVENEASAGGGGGILAFGPELSVNRCVIGGNEAGWGDGGGILCGSPALAIRDCLVTHNFVSDIYEGGGIAVMSSYGVIDGCTVAHNEGASPPGGLLLISSEIEVDNTIIAINDGMALVCHDSPQITVRCCDVYGNTEGDDICGTDLGGNFSADPLFCDAVNGEYTLDGCSPCLPGNHPDGVECGLIGALGQGCGATAIEKTSWGRIKALYRR